MASGQVTLGEQPQFSVNLAGTGIDLQQALASQKAKVAGMIRGILDGQVQVSGKGTKLDQIKPTLKGSGRATVTNGKLIGVNVAREALDKTKGLPLIGDLVPASVVRRHPELFDNPDTDIREGSLSFTLQGPKITTHDLVAWTPDYGMTGKGWFDMDKNIDLDAHVVLTREFTREIIAEKKNVSYLTNRDGEVDIRLAIRGQLPKPHVLPDIGDLAQRVGSRLVERQGKTLRKLLKGNPLKGLFP